MPPGAPGRPGSPAGSRPGAPGTRGTRGDRGEGPGVPGANQELELPEHCLVRLLDITVQPGKTYEYGLQVRMSNPNRDRRDVANPNYAKEAELHSEWSTVPIQLQVPPEMRYYAVDQRDWAKEHKEKYKGPNRMLVINRDRQMILQAHRWLESVQLRNQNPMLFGEWTVAEAFAVHRGEYVGKTVRIEAPVWRFTLEDFVIASDTTTTRRRKGIDVYFGFAPNAQSQQEAILVDFEQARQGYEKVVSRTEDAVKTQKVSDDCGQQALIMKPDGRLMLLEGARDFDDEERTERLEKVEKRIEDVKHKKPAGGAPGRQGSPFGGS
jgi:hypothetical protein